MYDFGKIVYLDLHKTGSTFISKFLQNCCVLKENKFNKHDWIREDYDSKNFYFISIRHPMAMYSSLYRFGLAKKGAVWNRLHKSDNLSVYSSFNSFVDFLCHEDNANLLGYGYNQIYAKHIGFMSFRFLKLSLQFPHKIINYHLKAKGNIDGLEKLFVTNLEIKNENLIDELRVLATEIHPQYFNHDAVYEFLHKSKKENVSSVNHHEIDELTDVAKLILNQKKNLLFSRYQ